jgi:exopolyphosphatase/guanosine-5'-triphosphate,3'-diphosphate pyrophosphatase
MNTVAAVDIGTNTLRMLIAKRNEEGHIIFLLKEKKIVRLGEGFKTYSVISEEAICRGIHLKI